MTPIRILFVCWGNICRSPAAENVFRKLVKEAGLQDRIVCDSAGTLGYHQGEPPDARMSAAARKRGIYFTGHSRKFDDVADFVEFDLILAMDKHNLSDLYALDSKQQYREKVRLFGEYLDEDNPPEIPDPYYGGRDGFDRVMDMVEEGCRKLLLEVAPID